MAFQRRPWKRKKAQPAAERNQLCAVCMAGDKNGHNEAGNSWAFMLPPMARASGRARQPRPSCGPGEGARGAGMEVTVRGPHPLPGSWAGAAPDVPQAGPAPGLVTQGPALRRVPCVAERSAITALNFLRLFEQGACGFILHWVPQMM